MDEQLPRNLNLVALHCRAARSVLSQRFPQTQLMQPREFLRHCTDAGTGRRLGFGPSLEPLEGLHRLGLVGPLLISDRGTSEIRVCQLDEYAPWSDHGSPRDELSWTTIYYHPVQALLVHLVESSLLQGLNFRPEFYEWIANDPDPDLSNVLSLIRSQIDASRKYQGRLERLLGALPDLLLADQKFGPVLRGFAKHPVSPWIFAGSHDRFFERYDKWRSAASADCLARRLTLTPEALETYARELYLQARSEDPLEKWSDLLPFIPYKLRQKLSGSALASQRTYELALLIGHLVGELTARTPWEVIDPETASWQEKRLGGPLDPTSQEQLFYVSNRFGVNPTPALIWYVEGESERAAIETISSHYSDLISREGIKVLSMRGNGNLRNLELPLYTARDFGADVMVSADKDDPGVKAAIGKAVNKGWLALEDVHFSDPDFETENFSWKELAAAINSMIKVRNLRQVSPLAGEDLEDARDWRRGWCASLTGCQKLSECALNDHRARQCEHVLRRGAAPPLSPPKPELVTHLCRTVLIPELEQKDRPPRPIVRIFDQALTRAAKRRRFHRPGYHPNIFGDQDGDS